MAMIEAYQNRLNTVADNAAEHSRTSFLSLPSIQREYLGDFIEAIRPVLEAAQIEASELAAALIIDLADKVPKFGTLTLPEIVFDMPFHHTWHDLKGGMRYEDARLGGAGRAEQLGRDATYGGANARMEASGLKKVGFRRVINAGACEWCQLVSVQRYRSMESANFGHGGRGKANRKNCRCVVVTIWGHRDPGRTLNQRRYAELKAQGVPERVNEAHRRQAARARAGQ